MRWGEKKQVEWKKERRGDRKLERKTETKRQMKRETDIWRQRNKDGIQMEIQRRGKGERMWLDIVILILWEFNALYFDHNSPLNSSHICPLYLHCATRCSSLHGVQFVLNYFSWGWGLPWSVVGLPRVASLNKGDSPRSYQMPTVPQVGVDFSPSPHPRPCLNVAWLELVQALCLLSQLPRVTMCSWPLGEDMIWMIL